MENILLFAETTEMDGTGVGKTVATYDYVAHGIYLNEELAGTWKRERIYALATKVVLTLLFVASSRRASSVITLLPKAFK